MFPQRLGAPQAYGVAKAMIDRCKRRCRLSRPESARVQRGFETANGCGPQRAEQRRFRPAAPVDAPVLPDALISPLQ